MKFLPGRVQALKTKIKIHLKIRLYVNNGVTTHAIASLVSSSRDLFAGLIRAARASASAAQAV